MQVAGRAGRANITGKVLIQTKFPGHPLYHALQRHNYEALAQTLLTERKVASFPPFAYQALLRAEAPQLAIALDFLASAAMSRPEGNVEMFDPVPAQMARLKGMERAHLLVQSSSRKELHKFLTSWRTKLDKLSIRNTRWVLDVDPFEF
jgi:primosomal protein N' (replication factor Y)